MSSASCVSSGERRAYAYGLGGAAIGFFAPLPVDPHQRPLRLSGCRGGVVHQSAVCGDIEDGGVADGQRGDPFEYRHRLARDGETIPVKRDGPQGPLPHEDNVSAFGKTRRRSFEQYPRLPIVEPNDSNTIGPSPTRDGEQQGAAVGKKLRERVELTVLRLGERLWCSSRVRNLHEPG